LGEALADQGYVTLALAQYQGATDAWRRVVQDSSASLEDCTGLADSLVSLGGLQDRMGDANAALAKINEALEIGTEALLGPGPHVKCPLRPAQIAPYLDAKALEILGQVTILRAQMLNLKEDYDGTLAFAEGAARLRPHSVSTRRQALVSRAWWGHGQEDRQRKENAHRRTFDEVNSLLQLDPDNRQWQRERAAIQLVIAQDLTACKSSKDSVPCAAEGAEAAVLEAIATLKALNGIDPGDASRRSDLGWALQAHGELLEAESRGEEALQKLEEAEKEYRNAIMDWKNDVDGLKSYGRLLWQKAKLFASLGRAGDATKVVDEAVRQAADLLAAHPGNQGLVDYLIGARAIESDIRHKVGDMDGAKRAAEEASRLQKGYDDATKRVWTRSDTLYKGFSQHLEAGAGLYEKGDYGGALRELEKAEAVAREYILVRPADREGYKQLANIYDWLRLVRPEDGGTRAKAADLAARMRSAQLAALLAPADQKAEANFDLLKARFDHDKFLYDHADGDPQTLEKVLSLLQAEVVLAESLVQTDSRNALYLWKQGDATAGVGMVRRDLGRPGAEEAMLSGLVYLEKAARIEPSNERYSMDAANVRSMLAQMYREHGRYPDAKKEYSAALKAYQQAARTSPGDRGTLDAIEEINKELAALERARQAGRQGQK
jgi:tetratricopeptide (TPR) repeat protein